MTSRKRSSLRRRSRARSQTRLTRNGVMGIVVPVAVAGVGVAAYLIWKKSRSASASVSTIARDAEAAAPSLVDSAVSTVVDAAVAAKNAANAAFFSSKDAAVVGQEIPKAALKGIGSYIDVSAAGAPYQGMFGVGGVGPVNTVIPTDAIRRAGEFRWVRPVTQQFADPDLRTGGTFARNLFT